MALRQGLLTFGKTAGLVRWGAPGLGRTVTTSSFLRQSEPVAIQSEPESEAGWGQTKISTILKEKGKDSGAWCWCSKDDTVFDAVKKMAKANVGSLVVFDPSKLTPDVAGKYHAASTDAVLGIITERDYLTKVVVQGRSSAQLKVAQIMTPQEKLQTVAPDRSVLEVMEMMVDKSFRHVPVVDGGELLGMISIRDVVHVMVKEHRNEVGKLQEYIQGTY